MSNLILENSNEAVHPRLAAKIDTNSIIKKTNLTNNSIYNRSQGDILLLADQNSNSNSSIGSSSENSAGGNVVGGCDIGDQRTMDAADTLVSLANTPTTEFKSFASASLTNSPKSPNANNSLEIVNKFFILFNFF